MTVTPNGWRWIAAAALTGAVATIALARGATPAMASQAPPATVILLDDNGSLAGANMAAERRAALAYVKALPAGLPAGLIVFADGWRVAVPVTTDHARLSADIRATRAVGGATSRGIRGALAEAASSLASLAAPAPSRLLVLTDAEVLTGAPLTSPVPADVITWYVESDDNISLMRHLASASAGRYVTPTRAAALASVFPQVVAPRQRPSASPGTRAAAAPARGSGSSPPLPAVLALVFLDLLVVALVALGPAMSGDRRRHLVRQIERYGPRYVPAVQSGQHGITRSAMDLTSQLLVSSRAAPGLAQRLDLAGLARKPAEWVLIGAGVCAGLAAVLTLLVGSALVGVPVGAIAGWAGMRLFVSVRISRRRAAFAGQLPDMLQFVAGALRSGFSLGQALDAAVREDAQPASGEFRRALAEARVGVDLDVALDGVADRMDSDDLRWTVMAIRIQREVGGNLAEVLGNTIATMRERAYLHRHVRALSAEGRLSAYVLIALPLLMGGWLLLTDRAYLSPLYTTVIGGLMLFIALALFVVGVIWMRVVIKVEV